MTAPVPDNPSRRTFIKGVIAAGAAASSATYLFRTTTISGQSSAPGSVERLISLNVNGQERRVDVMKQETLAMTLRYKLGLTKDDVRAFRQKLMTLRQRGDDLIRTGITRSDFLGKLRTDDLNWPFPKERIEPLYDELAAKR